MKNRIIHIAVFLLFLNAFCVFTKESMNSNDLKNSQKIYTETKIEKKTYDKKRWETLSKKIKIKEPKEKEKKKDKKDKKKNKFNWNLEPTDFLISIFKWGTFAVLIGALLFIVLKILGLNPFTNENKELKIQVNIENIEEHLNLADISPYLYESLKNKNYKLAIRLYYLMIIQKLDLKEKIKWKKHKTNRNYLQEMLLQNDYKTFKNLTGIYERIWFGPVDLDEQKYNIINADFVNYLQNIKENE